MNYLALFWSFFQIGLFSFGGGMAAMPLIQEQAVTIHSWLSLSEFADLVTLSEMTPGPIAVNASTFVGTRLAGFPGALVATLGCILPSCVLVSILAWLYKKYGNLDLIRGTLSGLRPAVVALISSAGLSILMLALWGSGSITLGNTNWFSLVLFTLGLFVLRKWKPSPVVVMLACGVIGGIFYTLTGSI